MAVKLHPAYLIFGCVYIVLGQGAPFLLSLLAVLLHEYAHIFEARRVGLSARGVTLYPYGGQVDFDEFDLTPGDEIKITLIGPLFNLVIATLIMAVWWIFPSAYPYTETFYKANLFNGLLNLLPVYPLDGGRVMLALLKKKFSWKISERICRTIGYMFSLTVFAVGVFMCFHLNFSYLILAIFLIINQMQLQGQRYHGGLLSSRKYAIAKRSALKVSHVMVNEDLPVYKLLSMIVPDTYTVFHITDENLIEKSVVTEQQLYERAKQGNIYQSVNKLFAAVSG